MNYALDALWWRLTHPDVRALAGLLTAPALWHTGCELPVRLWLGEQGFRCLLDWDEHPEALMAHLAQEHPFGCRLGKYAESLLAFWFAHAPHSELLAREVVLKNGGGDTLGALDFLVRLNGALYHVELTCKYYGAQDGSCLAQVVGLNAQDRLLDKSAKLAVQLANGQHPASMSALAELGIRNEALSSVSIVRGMLFSDEPHQAVPPVNSGAWLGGYVSDWAACPVLSEEGRYYVIPKMEWLAPARVDAQSCLSSQQVSAVGQGLVAVLEQRPDGYWHETGRLMKVLG